jgi:hypothetical protein
MKLKGCHIMILSKFEEKIKMKGCHITILSKVERKY